MLLPTTCPVCGRTGRSPCARCAAELRPAPALPPPSGVDGCRAVVAYEGVGRELVARLKYRNARSSLTWLAVAMARLAARLLAGGGAGGRPWVTWLPTTGRRRRDRGFDQAELLARAVARRLGVPCRALLVRAPGPPQTGRSRTERRRGPGFVLRRAPPETVVLVDDVVTTGTSVSAAARALRAAGARRVLVVAAARTPPRSRRSVVAPADYAPGIAQLTKEGWV
jgi:predicted amidophosphoribosyltransferase